MKSNQEQWVVSWYTQYSATFAKEVPKGWEPFTVTRDGQESATIWIRRKETPDAK